MWNEINNESDLNTFCESVGYFHDSCIKEMIYKSGAYVEKNLSMMPINRERKLNVVIQRQYNDPSVVELEFTGLVKMNLIPNPENKTCEMLGVTMEFRDGFIYFLDDFNFPDDDFEKYTGTLICAEKLRWRAVNQYLGEGDEFSYSSATEK